MTSQNTIHDVPDTISGTPVKSIGTYHDCRQCRRHTQTIEFIVGCKLYRKRIMNYECRSCSSFIQG